MGTQSQNRKKVIVLSTGGTIAGVGEEGRNTGYSSGVISPEELINSAVKAIGGTKLPFDIETIQISNINSDDINSKIWILMVKYIDTLSKRDDVLGFVITHGTDTMEETAYFLSITVKTDKPVVLTGAMRPISAVSPDGPGNLLDALYTAADEASVGRGVMVVFSGRIFSGESIRKSSTFSPDPMKGKNIGYIFDGKVIYTEEKCNTYLYFDISETEELPKVPIIYFHTEASSEILKFAAGISKGIVIAGAGAGEYSKEFLSVLESLEIPVVISTGVEESFVERRMLLLDKTIAAGELSPKKAAILLRTALIKTDDTEEIKTIFENN